MFYNFCIDSTKYQLTDIYISFREAVDSGKEVRIVFCDKSKAFDRVGHTGLLYKLQCIGISGRLLDWFRNYLADRKQRVVINGSTSEFKLVESGVPQFSILGPLLFLISINNIVRELKGIGLQRLSLISEERG